MWKTTTADLTLKDDAKPVCSRPYPVPKAQKAMFRKEVEILVSLGLLEEANESDWGVPSFAQPKDKTNHVRFLSDFQNLNRKFKRKLYPVPTIQEMLLNLDGFKYATSLDLNMDCYRIHIIEQSGNLCTIILPWVKCQYKRLPMGVRNSREIFQENINKMFRGFEFI